jgi:hypothetical protein
VKKEQRKYRGKKEIKKGERKYRRKKGKSQNEKNIMEFCKVS